MLANMRGIMFMGLVLIYLNICESTLRSLTPDWVGMGEIIRDNINKKMLTVLTINLLFKSGPDGTPKDF